MEDGEIVRQKPHLTEKGKRVIQLLPVMNDSQIAKEVGLTRERVRQLRNKIGIESPAKGQHCSPFWTEEKISQVVKLTKAGLIASEIAREMGIMNGDIVRHIARKYNIQLNSKREMMNQCFFEAISPDLTQEQIAKKLGWKVRTVSKYCQRYKVKTAGWKNISFKGVGNKPRHSDLKIKKLIDESKPREEIAMLLGYHVIYLYQRLARMRKKGIDV